MRHFRKDRCKGFSKGIHTYNKEVRIQQSEDAKMNLMYMRAEVIINNMQWLCMPYSKCL